MLALSAWSGVAAAQGPEGSPASPPAPSGPPSIEPPALLEAARATLPEGIEPPSADLPITLVVTLDPEGAVVAAEVVEAGEPAYDEAARDAALRSRFSPARRDRVAMPSRIRLVVVVPAPIELAPAETPPEASESPAERSAPEPAAEAAAIPVDDADATPPGDAAGAVDEEEVLEVTAVAESRPSSRERSAEAVDVVDLSTVRRTSAELGDVLARSEGVSIRRSGGLGSAMRFSINGLGDDRIRVFLDGVPIEYAGFPMSFGNMPVQLLDWVEIYRGVVPVRYGADALGGAVDLGTAAPRTRPMAALGYQVGSFGTHRLSLTAQARAPRSGLFARGSAFLDAARNDFPVQVHVDDLTGGRRRVSARRFHDAYLARGGALEVGVSRRGIVELLSIRAFGTEYDKDLQHNTIMSTPYGEVTYGEGSYGAMARAALRVSGALRVFGVAGYARRRTDFWDRSLCVYSWLGECTQLRSQPGEIEFGGYDQTVQQDAGFARLSVEWELRPEVSLNVTLAPTYTTRDGVDRTVVDPGIADPLALLRRQLVLVSGAEVVGRLERLEAVAFAKSYVYRARAEDTGVGDQLRLLARDANRFGGGASLRFEVDRDAYLKASYEYATRLPSPDETFGNGVLVQPNLELEPEISHNLNLGGTLERPIGSTGALRFEVSAFGRLTDQLILLLGTNQDYTYQNVYAARALGVEAEARYLAPRDHGHLSANLTYQDYRNVASSGTFGTYDGDRIPNQPALFVNLEARAQLRDVVIDDALSLTVLTRYVNAYYRGWESLGTLEGKQRIPSQTVLSSIVEYAFRVNRVAGSVAVEARNLTDARVFDFFGIQRPGRSFFVQLALEL